MRVSKADFKAIQRKIADRQKRRQANVAFNAAVANAAAPSARLGRMRGKSSALPLKSISRRIRAQELKKQGHALWSLKVRERDGHKCLMCGSVKYLNAHHWLFRKSHSVRLALDIANGATLCAYPCHLGRIHKDGDGDFMLRLADKMTEIVGSEKVAQMREIGRNPSPVSLEEIDAMVMALK